MCCECALPYVAVSQAASDTWLPQGMCTCAVDASFPPRVEFVSATALQAGETALKLATKGGKADVVAALRAAGAKNECIIM